jgi:hypothetical protein
MRHAKDEVAQPQHNDKFNMMSDVKNLASGVAIVLVRSKMNKVFQSCNSNLGLFVRLADRGF